MITLEFNLVFIIDGSGVGYNCITFMISLIYDQCALPITGLVVKGCKGYLPELVHSDFEEHGSGIIYEGKYKEDFF